MRQLIKLLICLLTLSPDFVLGETMRWRDLKETSAGSDIWVNKYTGRLFNEKLEETREEGCFGSWKSQGLENV